MTVSVGPGWDIGPGWTLGGVIQPGDPLISLDAANYSGSGPWIDTASNIPFTLFNSPTYSSVIGGGSFNFSPASQQYARSQTTTASLPTWTVLVWHYYDGTNSGGNPCILTESYPINANTINYFIGNQGTSNADLQTGFYNPPWYNTPAGYQLTPGNWYQIVGTYDGATIKLYVNNTVVTSYAVVGNPTAGFEGIRLMQCWDDPNGLWGGKLAIVKIYNGDMGAGWIANNWNTTKARFDL
jgi:hypothetical protein